MNDDERSALAGRLRQLNHDFVARDLVDVDLDELSSSLATFEKIIDNAPLRSRDVTPEDIAKFRLPSPDAKDTTTHEIFSDSFVSGLSSPSGIGGQLHREGDHSVMTATIGKAFEGTPGRAHGGIIAALLDETMGWVPGFNKKLAFTAQLDITYLSPAPINTPLELRAWSHKVDGRKNFIHGVVLLDGVELARATSLFIEIDPELFLQNLMKKA